MNEEYIEKYKVSDIIEVLGKDFGVDGYLNRFRLLEQGKRKMNWSAFFLTSTWLVYRRMWELGLGLCVFSMAGLFLSRLLLVFIITTFTTTYSQQIALLLIAAVGYITVGIICCIIVGLNGDKWYWEHIKKIIDEYYSREHVDGEEVLADLGGTRFRNVIFISILSNIALGLIK